RSLDALRCSPRRRSAVEYIRRALAGSTAERAATNSLIDGGLRYPCGAAERPDLLASSTYASHAAAHFCCKVFFSAQPISEHCTPAWGRLWAFSAHSGL